jgi:hypothetical protein
VGGAPLGSSTFFLLILTLHNIPLEREVWLHFILYQLSVLQIINGDTARTIWEHRVNLSGFECESRRLPAISKCNLSI